MIQPVNIRDRPIGPGNPCFIVAEISANHNPSIELGDHQSLQHALRLIDLAKESGADAVKLQTYSPDTMTIHFENDKRRNPGK